MDAGRPAPGIGRAALGLCLGVAALAGCGEGDGPRRAQGPRAGPAVIAVAVAADGAPVQGALVEVRAFGETVRAVTTGPTGRARVSLDTTGGVTLRVARDSAVPRPDRVHAPVLLLPGTVMVAVDLGAGPDGAVRYGTDQAEARWGRVMRAVTRIARRQESASLAWRDGGRPSQELDRSREVAAVLAALEDERHPEVRAALWYQLLWLDVLGAEVSRDQADRALRELRPDAAVWGWQPRAAWRVLAAAARTAEGVGSGRDTDPESAAGRRALAARRAAAYLDRMIEAHADPRARSELLLGAMRMAEADGRADDASAYHRRLLAEYPETRAADAAGDHPPTRPLQVGDPVPALALPALDPTAPPITADRLAGPATLVDFWATWCIPCVAEMPTIHAAYERFRERGFDVVSVSGDADRADVRRFRERFPMPWRHAFVGLEAVGNGPVARAYGITGLPFAVLVGPDGRVLATHDALRGRRLAETLERVLTER